MSTFESDLGYKFAPTYHSSKGEANCLVKLEPRRDPTFARGYPPWEPYVYFSTYFVGTHGGEDSYEINYLTIWEWDTGTRMPIGVQGSHQWDTERMAVLVAGPRGRLSSISLGGQIVALKVSAKILRAVQECCMEKDIKPL